MSSDGRRIAALSIVCHQAMSFYMELEQRVPTMPFGEAVRQMCALNAANFGGLIECRKDLGPDGECLRRTYRLLRVRIMTTFSEAAQFVGVPQTRLPTFQQAKEALDRIEKRNDKGNTDLLRTTCSSAFNQALRLVALGADVNATNRNGHTALIWAVNRGHEGLVKSLLEAKARPNAMFDREGTVLIQASCDGKDGMIQHLLAARADLSITGKEGRTALHWAAFNGHAAAVTLLLAAKADPRVKDDHGQTPLAGAIQYKRLTVIPLLQSATKDS
jgi:ankyrin repeat protein